MKKNYFYVLNVSDTKYAPVIDEDPIYIYRDSNGKKHFSNYIFKEVFKEVIKNNFYEKYHLNDEEHKRNFIQQFYSINMARFELDNERIFKKFGLFIDMKLKEVIEK